MSFVSVDDLIGSMLDRVKEISDSRNRKISNLSENKKLLRTICGDLKTSFIHDLDNVFFPGDIVKVAVDGAHIADLDRGNSFSISVAFSLFSNGEKMSSACLASLPHLLKLDDVSTGFMFMQEIMLAVVAAEKYPDSIVMTDGSRVSVLIELDNFYRFMSRFRPGLLNIWRRSKTDFGNLLNLFESDNWLERYLLMPNIVSNTKLVTTRRLVEHVVDKYDSQYPFIREMLYDFDDKMLSNVVLFDSDEFVNGRGMGPISLKMPMSPFKIQKDDSGSGDGYPHSDRIDEVLYGDGYKRDGYLGFQVYFVNPIRSHGCFSLEVNDDFQNSSVGKRLMSLRNFSKNVSISMGLASLIRDETPSLDIQEPYLVHVADRLCKKTVSSIKDVFVTGMKSEFDGDLGWLLSLSHRTR